MRTRDLMMAAACTALISAPVLAQQSNGQQTRQQARQNSQGPANADQRGIQRSDDNSVLKGGQSSGDEKMRRGKSQGSANASDRAGERANQNSAVQAGMMVHDKNNKMIGRVKEVKRAPDGTVIAIVVVLVVVINGTNQITLTPAQFQIIAGVIVAIGIVAPTGY
jgi:hypothetical protein